jgi:hypothetical protein
MGEVTILLDLWWGPDRHRDALISYLSAGNYLYIPGLWAFDSFPCPSL